MCDACRVCYAFFHLSKYTEYIVFLAQSVLTVSLAAQNNNNGTCNL